MALQCRTRPQMRGFEAALWQLYVSMTRATRQRVLSAHGESAVVARVRVSLQAVAQRFAASTGSTG